MPEAVAAPAAPAPAAPATPEAAANPTAELAGEKPPEKKDEPVVPPKPEVRRHKLKVDGAEVEVDDDELKRGYSLSQASYKRMEEVSKLKKELQGFTAAFKKDPVSVMRQLASGEGGESKAFREQVEKFLYEEMQREKMDPRERALVEREEKLRVEEQKRTAWAEEQEAARLQAQQDYWSKKYDEDISAALAEPGIGLPKTAATVGRMAELMSKALTAGIDVAAKDVARLVRDEQLKSQKELLGGLTGEQLISFLGEETVKKIRLHEVALLRKAPAAAPAPAPAAAPKGPAPRKTMSERDFDNHLKQLINGQ